MIWPDFWCFLAHPKWDGWFWMHNHWLLLLAWYTWCEPFQLQFSMRFESRRGSSRCRPTNPICLPKAFRMRWPRDPVTPWPSELSFNGSALVSVHHSLLTSRAYINILFVLPQLCSHLCVSETYCNTRWTVFIRSVKSFKEMSVSLPKHLFVSVRHQTSGWEKFRSRWLADVRQVGCVSLRTFRDFHRQQSPEFIQKNQILSLQEDEHMCCRCAVPEFLHIISFTLNAFIWRSSG